MGDSFIKSEKAFFGKFRFDSKWERDVYLMLKADKKVSDIERQRTFTCMIEGIWVCDYTADFVFREEGKEKRVVLEAKGYWPEKDRLRYKIAAAMFSKEFEFRVIMQNEGYQKVWKPRTKRREGTKQAY